MIDAQWEPPRDTAIHPNENTNEKNYSEVTSGSWYRRTYEKMKSRHKKRYKLFSFACCVSTWSRWDIVQ